MLVLVTPIFVIIGVIACVESGERRSSEERVIMRTKVVTEARQYVVRSFLRKEKRERERETIF